MLKYCISNDQSYFECQSQSKKARYITYNSCYVNKARAKFLLTLVQYTGRNSYSSCFILSANIFKHFLVFVLFMLGQHLKFSYQHSKCKPKYC